MKATAFFHLNLAYSSLDEHQHLDVIDHAYEPILDLAETYPIGLEINGWSLERIAHLKPSFISRLSELIKVGKVDIFGSGYIQMIMALAPNFLNEANLIWGQKVFQELLGTHSTIFHPPELVLSPEMIDIAKSHGYKHMIIEYENLMDSEDWPKQCPTHSGQLGLIPCSTLMMQSTQKYVAGDLSEKQFLNNLSKQPTWTTIYSGDAEIFGFRPNRYKHEHRARLAEDWPKLRALIATIAKERQWERISNWPHQKRQALKNPFGLTLVKKQWKYNLSRWSTSGRNDVWLNTICQRWATLLQSKPPTSKYWKPVLKLCASDLRTHITERRWARVAAKIERFRRTLGQPLPFGFPLKTEKAVAIRSKEQQMVVDTPSLQACLQLRRGCAIEKLHFKDQPHPCIQSFPQGHFQSMALFADFWSGTSLMEGWREDQRWTDLNPVQPKVLETAAFIRVSIHMPCPFGRYDKHLTFYKNEAKATLAFQFEGELLHEGTLHVGNFTLADGFKPDSWGWQQSDGSWRQQKIKEMNPTQSVSGRVSSRPLLSTPNGNFSLNSGEMGICFQWNPSMCAALPMLKHAKDSAGHMTRLLFSLAERDETRHAHPAPPPLEISLFPKN